MSKPAGQVKGDGLPLTFVRVADAGHMVPMDVPRASLEMIEAFTRGRSIVAGKATASSLASTPQPSTTTTTAVA